MKNIKKNVLETWTQPKENSSPVKPLGIKKKPIPQKTVKFIKHNGMIWSLPLHTDPSMKLNGMRPSSFHSLKM